MTEKSRADKVVRPVNEGEATEEVVNDSLGTVDLADSTGCDSDKKAEAEKTERAMDKKHP